ncbi:hypothetical protein FJ251_07870 [bacterium]|nr:hypothetical protein [bacterium]
MADVTVLAASYGTQEGAAAYDNDCDVGPTDSHLGDGIPETDSRVNFEDLMIVALTYDDGSPQPAATGTAMARLTWYRLDEYRWALGLLEPCRDLKGLSLRLDLPAAVTVAVTAGPLLAEQEGPYFLKGGEDLSVGLAMLGPETTIRGEGERLRVEFSAPLLPDPPEIVCRSASNEAVEFTLEETAIAELPTRYQLVGNSPNPFNPKTSIRFDLVDAQAVRLAIFDLSGRCVRMLLDESLPAGAHAVAWDGRDAAGQALPSGVYLYRIEAGPLRETAKMLLLR